MQKAEVGTVVKLLESIFICKSHAVILPNILKLNKYKSLKFFFVSHY